MNMNLVCCQLNVSHRGMVSGGYSYQIKGCAGQGGFAQVFKACCDGNPDEVVALKVK